MDYYVYRLVLRWGALLLDLAPGGLPLRGVKERFVGIYLNL